MLGALGFLALGASTQDARAATVVQANGWDGNSVIYMTSATNFNSGNPYYIQTQWNTVYQPWSANCDSLNNAINLTVGEDRATPSGTLVFEEYYDSGSQRMDVYLPIATGAGNQIAGPGPWASYYTIVYHEVAVNSNSPYSFLQFNSAYDQGINITGNNNAGTTKSQYLYNLGFDALGFLPGVGMAVGSYQVMKDFQGLTGVDQNNPSQQGSGTAYEWFTVINGTSHGWHNTLSAQTYVTLYIGQGGFGSSPVFTLSAVNQLGVFGIVQCTGATISLPLYAVPAVYLTGQVTALGYAVPGALVNIEPTSGGTIYQVTTDSSGNYRFFAQLNTAYYVWATYSTAFGTATSSTYSLSADSSPTYWPALNIDFTAYSNTLSDIYGRVTSASTGAAIGGAKMSATLQGTTEGCAVCATTDSNGNYHFFTPSTGTYTEQASASGYNVGTAYPTVSALGASYLQNFALTKPSGGGGGCVVAGTQIAAPNGQKRVELLSQGDTVLGYNITSGSWVKESVTSNTATNVIAVVSINNGLLETTLVDQPLYVQNGTWTGWVHDPLNLSVGEQVYDPSTGSWITITSLQLLTGYFTVYDLRVTAPNDFVANGVLALDKIG